ncbi:hypothetical protein Cni_G06408 [Canna indica]|uniref:Uncharacterized protein n=1 Tax=Canna indica TaxID=4628 RepID=A0AAQ3K1F5_9LILI|nr:hypothetical protein Cni_G06408 [Canna indica]
MVMRGKNNLDTFYGRLMEVLRSRQWEVYVAPERRDFGSGPPESATMATMERVRMPVVKVLGSLRKEQELWESTDKCLQDAFPDLNALMVFLKLSLLSRPKFCLTFTNCNTIKPSAG